MLPPAQAARRFPGEGFWCKPGHAGGRSSFSSDATACPLRCIITHPVYLAAVRRTRTHDATSSAYCAVNAGNERSLAHYLAAYRNTKYFRVITRRTPKRRWINYLARLRAVRQSQPILKSCRAPRRQAVDARDSPTPPARLVLGTALGALEQVYMRFIVMSHNP